MKDSKREVAALVEKLVRPEIRALSAYHVPPAAGLIKLDAMENPYRWPEDMVAAWWQVLKNVRPNRYPDADAVALKTSLRANFAVPEDLDLILGNGSDELIQLVIMALAQPGATVMSVEPSFSMYGMLSSALGLNFEAVPLGKDDFRLDASAMLRAMRAHPPAVVFLSYPNNPTGNLFDAEAMGRVIDAAPGLVVIDEAYAPFAQTSFLGELAAYPNVLIMRTLSKLGLAGLRLGVLVGATAWIEQFEKLRLPYNINCLTQVSAEFALSYSEVFEAQTRQIREDRGRLHQALSALEGLTVFSSAANFMLIRMPKGRGTQIAEGLKERGVLVKNLHGASPLLEDCLRVTVGEAAENDAFLTALKQALA